jgi:arsenate reductase (glutaredoxin)
MLSIYHNPRCRKSREGLEYLKNKNLKPEIINYMADGIDPDALKILLRKLDKKPFEIVRTQEEMYKKELKEKNLSDEDWISILTENPRLIQRPIVETDSKAVIGNPPENIDTIIE